MVSAGVDEDVSGVSGQSAKLLTQLAEDLALWHRTLGVFPEMVHIKEEAAFIRDSAS